VGILIKNTINYSLIEIHNYERGLEYIIIRIPTDKQYLTLANVYIHPGIKTNRLHEVEKIIKNNKNIICLGDFNAHHNTWSIGNENNTGKALNEIIVTNNCTVVGDKNLPTRYNPRTQKSGSPDLVFIDKDIATKLGNWRTGDDVGSDHLPIIFSLSVTQPTLPEYRNRHWQYGKCDKKKLKETIEKEMKELIETIHQCENIDEKYEELRAILIKSATKVCPRSYKKEGFNGNPWWNAECKTEIKKRNKTRRILQKRGNYEAYTNY
jgi:hypothetical protein